MARFGPKARAALAVAVLGLIGASLARIGRRAGPDPGAIARRALGDGRLPAAEPELRRAFEGSVADRQVDEALAKIRIEAFWWSLRSSPS